MELLGFSILKPQQVEIVEAALSKRDCLVVMPTVSGKSACFLLPGLIEHGCFKSESVFRKPTYNKFAQTLSKYFEATASRVVEAALSKRDFLVVMPTVSGKSACFLLPGLIEHGVTVVISPLKSLIDLATQDEEEEENSDGEQNFDWGDESHQQDWGDKTLDLDHHYGDEIPAVSDDDDLADLEISFASTIDLTMDEEINLDLVEELEKRKRMSNDGPMQCKRQKLN
ncbi:hypothetical protein DAPPUDRAFT_331480 [Daphnia pulex]|uniref:DEAD/DEAH-box helicase domain-containing protein n=1 Tax=Daphnia pulex TaxID=6669 RepID=E9HML3_DAPPU|nr:hypothetical protein DAPPUDRAFT_333285 [Daphnia pulex]EFX66986.1 hypothetical protein DAPPUDRAFT_331480 [Daphnia pulex]|eukprot:EFX65336.1 hypothetical protein DAPPUDRAFT_333285 [Daphnia pulex]